MKKPSTTTVFRMRKLQDGRLTIGLDLGDRSSFYCVLNGAGDVVLEAKVATNPEAMRQTFEMMPRSRIALETGTHSPWVSRLLIELGYEAIVAHSRNVRLIGESRRKDDRLDAQALARLARIDPKAESLMEVRIRFLRGPSHWENRYFAFCYGDTILNLGGSKLAGVSQAFTVMHLFSKTCGRFMLGYMKHAYRVPPSAPNI